MTKILFLINLQHSGASGNVSMLRRKSRNRSSCYAIRFARWSDREHGWNSSVRGGSGYLHRSDERHLFVSRTTYNRQVRQLITVWYDYL